MSVGNRRVTEDSPKSIGGQVAKNLKTADNRTTKQWGSNVKDPQTIKLPKRRSSLQKNTAAQKPEVVSPPFKKPRVKPPATPPDTEGNRIAALKQRLLAVHSTQQRLSRKISIPVSRSEGNVAKKTRGLEDKVTFHRPLYGS